VAVYKKRGGNKKLVPAENHRNCWRVQPITETPKGGRSQKKRQKEAIPRLKQGGTSRTRLKKNVGLGKGFELRRKKK